MKLYSDQQGRECETVWLETDALWEDFRKLEADQLRLPRENPLSWWIIGTANFITSGGQIS